MIDRRAFMAALLGPVLAKWLPMPEPSDYTSGTAQWLPASGTGRSLTVVHRFDSWRNTGRDHLMEVPVVPYMTDDELNAKFAAIFDDGAC